MAEDENFFVVKLKILVSDEEERRLRKAFDCATQITNATIRSARGKLKRMREDPDWQKAKKMPAGEQKNLLFASVRKKHGLTLNNLRTIANDHRNGMKRKELGAHEAQCIGVNVWRSIEGLLFKNGGMPRYKTQNRRVRTVSGTDNHEIIWKPSLSAVVWRKHVYRVLVPDTPYFLLALTQGDTHRPRSVKFVRILRERIRGRDRYSALLTFKGRAPNLHAVASRDKVMGIDPGLSKFAFFTPELAGLQQLAPNVTDHHSEVAALNRKLDRSRRKTNPQNFNNKTGEYLQKQRWKYSNSYIKTKHKISEILRCEKETRRRDMGTTVNKLATLAGTFYIERNSYLAMQRRFGVIANDKAPGMLVERLKRLASRADLKVVELDPFAFRLSQFDPITEVYTKSPLRQRWSRWGDSSTIIQRDIKSALLAYSASSTGLDRMKAIEAFNAAEPLLREGGLVKQFQPRNDQDWASALSRLTKEPVADTLGIRRTSGPSQTQRIAFGTLCRTPFLKKNGATVKANNRSLGKSMPTP